MVDTVAYVFGLCALSFAAGCVVTAVMLRREPPPEPGVEPAPPAEEESRVEPRRPPEDYASKPIHRNPVMGLPTPPAPEPSRPTLVLVPDLEPDQPAAPIRVRRMHVVPDPDRTTPDRAGQEPPEPASTAGRPVHVVPDPLRPDPLRPDPVHAEVPAHPEPVTEPEAPAPSAELSPAEQHTAEQHTAEPTAGQPSAARPPAQADPPPHPCPLPDTTEFRRRYLRTFDAARRNSKP